MPIGRGGDRREIAVLTACLLLSVALFAFGRRLDTTWFARLEAVVLLPADRMRDFVESVLRERAENERLKHEVTRLRAERALLLRAGAEAERLRQALRFAEPQGPVLRPARVVDVDGEPWPQRYRLAVGSEAGVRVGQIVVAPEGLVGRVGRAGPGLSSVTLLTDPQLGVACEVLPGGARGVLRFRSGPRPGLYLSLVPLTDTVRVAEEVITSGLSSWSPEGLPVGSVVHVGRDPNGLVQEIEVRPHAPLTRLREVFVVVDAARLVPWSVQVPADSVVAKDPAAPPAAPPAGGPAAPADTGAAAPGGGP